MGTDGYEGLRMALICGVILAGVLIYEHYKGPPNNCYVRNCWPVDHDRDDGYTLECDELKREKCP